MANKPTLRERIKAEAASSMPSLIPAPHEKEEVLPPPPKEEEHVPTLNELIEDRKNRLAAARMIAELGEVNVELSALNKRKKPLQDNVKAFVSKLGVRKLQSGEWGATYYSAPRRSLKEPKLRAALLKRGVAPKDIDKIVSEASESSEGFTLRVSRLGETEDSE